MRLKIATTSGDDEPAPAKPGQGIAHLVCSCKRITAVVKAGKRTRRSGARQAESAPGRLNLQIVEHYKQFPPKRKRFVDQHVMPQLLVENVAQTSCPMAPTFGQTMTDK